METVIEKLKLSIYDKNFGTGIRQEKTAKSVKYLVILMAVIGSIIMIKADFKMYYGLDKFTTTLKNDYPDFELKDGYLFCQGDMPFIIQDKDAIIIFDTTGKTDASVLNGYSSGALITESTLVYKKNNVESRTYNLSEAKMFNFTRTGRIGIIHNWTIPALIFVFLFGVFFIFLWKMTGVFFLSLIALVLSKILSVDLDFQTLFKISIYAIVVPTIIDSGLDLAGVNIPHFWVVYYAIAIFYLWRFIKVPKENGDKTLSYKSTEAEQMTE